MTIPDDHEGTPEWLQGKGYFATGSLSRVTMGDLVRFHEMSAEERAELPPEDREALQARSDEFRATLREAATSLLRLSRLTAQPISGLTARTSDLTRIGRLAFDVPALKLVLPAIDIPRIQLDPSTLLPKLPMVRLDLSDISPEALANSERALLLEIQEQLADIDRRLDDTDLQT